MSVSGVTLFVDIDMLGGNGRSVWLLARCSGGRTPPLPCPGLPCPDRLMVATPSPSSTSTCSSGYWSSRTEPSPGVLHNPHRCRPQPPTPPSQPRPAPPGARRSMWVTHSAVLLEGKSRFIVLASLHCSAHATSALFIWYTIPDVLARYPETKSDNVTPVVARILIVEMMISSDMHS